jgi:diadenosine tetraphosphate (Ap4A) HIT family hydrolase
VVLADEPGYASFCRVIVGRHAREISDLSASERRSLWRVVEATEEALREVVGPDKVNVLSLGNMVPHVHVHVVARFGDDPHFPGPPFGPSIREGSPRSCDAQRLVDALRQRLGVCD